MKNRVNLNPSPGTLLEIGPPVIPRMDFNRFEVGVRIAFIFGVTGLLAFTNLLSGRGVTGKNESPYSSSALAMAWLFVIMACGAHGGLIFSLLWNCAVHESVRCESAPGGTAMLKVTRSLFGKISYTNSLALKGPVAVTVERGLEKNDEFKAYGFWDMCRPGTTFVSMSVGNESLVFGVCLAEADVNKIADHLRTALNPTGGASPGV